MYVNVGHQLVRDDGLLRLVTCKRKVILGMTFTMGSEEGGATL